MSATDEAVDLIRGDRMSDYGPPDEALGRIAVMWSAHLGVPVMSRDVAIMMTLLKVARLAHQDKHDSYVDAHAYLLLAEQLGT